MLGSCDRNAGAAAAALFADAIVAKEEGTYVDLRAGVGNVFLYILLVLSLFFCSTVTEKRRQQTRKSAERRAK